jgi:hypothetical protein
VILVGKSERNHHCKNSRESQKLMKKASKTIENPDDDDNFQRIFSRVFLPCLENSLI